MIEIGARFAVDEIIRVRREGEVLVFSTTAQEVRVGTSDARVLLDAFADRVRAAEKQRAKRLAAERKAKKAIADEPEAGR